MMENYKTEKNQNENIDYLSISLFKIYLFDIYGEIDVAKHNMICVPFRHFLLKNIVNFTVFLKNLK